MLTPIHDFHGCRDLRKEIEKLKKRDSIPEAILRHHQTYHYTLFYKLKGAKFHLERFRELLETFRDREFETEEFLFRANLNLDGFFYKTGSTMDILSREILSYFNIPLPRTVYYRTARELIATIRPSDPILPGLRDPAWKGYFTLYRNAITHEMLITEQCLPGSSPDEDAKNGYVKVGLPDAPRENAAERSFGKNPDALSYCFDILTSIISLINDIYSGIAERIAATGKLPL